MCYLTRCDDVLELFQKLHLQIMQANSWHHKLSHFHLSFWTWKVLRGRKKLQKFEYLENETRFFDETKNIFIVLEGLSFGEKIKKIDKK